MLVSIALAPDVLRPSSVHPPSVLRSLSVILQAVAQNGVIVCSDIGLLRTDLLQAAAQASGAAAQQFNLVATDLAKDIERYAVSLGKFSPSATTNPSLYSRCVEFAKWCRCDAIVVLDDQERQHCIAAGASATQIVLVEDFVDSSLNHKRLGWLTAQRLDTLERRDALALVGSIVRFAKKIVVADKMIGVAAKEGAASATRHLKGVAYLVDARSAALSNTKMPVELEIVSVAGDSGSRAGFIDPLAAKDVIISVLSGLGTLKKVSKVTVTLKQDGVPQMFNDRLLISGARAWGVHHGFDDLAKLMPVQPDKIPPKLRPTRIEPSSDALATTYRDIRALRDA